MEKPILMQQPTQLQQQSAISQPAPLQQKQAQQPRHILFDLTPLDTETEEIEEKTRRCYTTVKQMIAGKSAKECQEIYNQYIAANPQHHTDVLTMGLLVAILVEQNGQSDFYRDIVTFSKDNLALFSNHLNMIIIERISRISNNSIKQIFWITSQLIRGGVSSAENTCSNLIRQTAKGDCSPRNIYMAESVLELLIEHRAWVLNSTTFMGPTVIYNMTRLVIDHLHNHLESLMNREIEYVIGIIREKFEFVFLVGKDFLRMLMRLEKVGAFSQLYQDIFVNDPKTLHPSYEGPKQLLTTRTPRRLFQSCLTFDMERKISYLATQVKFGNQKRYQDWFHKQYLSSPESASLRGDLIRYICTIIHPSNEVLCSDIIPRWAIIGWLLTTVDYVVSQSRLALFFDWFAFDPKSDNIMNIEPAILVMYYSVRQHPQVTASLLDYLCRSHNTFDRQLSDFIRISIKKALQQILEKRVLPSLVPLFTNSKFEASLRIRLKESFPEFCQSDNGSRQNSSQAAQISSTTNSVTATIRTNPTLNDICNNDTIKQQSDVIAIDEETPNLTNPSLSTPDSSKPPQDDNHNPNLPSLGYQQQQKIQISPSNAIPKAQPNPRIPASTLKAQSSRNKNGSDPIQASTNVGSSSSANSKLAPAASSKKTAVIVPEASNDDSNLLSKRMTYSPFISNSDQFFGRNELISVFNENSSDLQLDPISTSNTMHVNLTDQSTRIKVIYPFMTVQRVVPDEIVEQFEEEVIDHLKHLSRENKPDIRTNHTKKIIELLVNDVVDSKNLENIGCHIANLICEDFEEKIHQTIIEDPSDETVLGTSPLFVFGSHLINTTPPKLKIIHLLAALIETFKAAGFLLLYYLRLNWSAISNSGSYAPKVYQLLCEACKRNKLTNSLVNDMRMMLTYDSEMFCYMLPIIYSDFAHYEGYSLINHPELTRMVVSAIDPISLQEFMCLCLTGSSKIISREEPLSIIESSIGWDSWEQYCFWKILAAASVPLENYISIISKLNAKDHPEAISSILLNLQKVSEPDESLLGTLVDAHNRQNDQFIAAIIRYWSIRTDLKDMTKNLTSLFDLKPSSPPVKRKGQTKATTTKNVSTASPTVSTTTLSTRSEKLLLILESIRRRAPRNKLLAQPDLLDTLANLEQMCNDSQRTKFHALFQLRLKPTKKKKLEKD